MASPDSTPSENAAALLRRSLERDRLGHAYLFLGDDLGRLEDAATALSQSLNCETPLARSPSGVGLEACRMCSSCRRILGRQHPDVLWVHPAKKLRQISVDQMRDVIHAISMKPMEARYKVGVIAGADRMNESAANAFLKTLEEPPRNSVLILLTTEPQRLLDTILSRCLRLNFGGGLVRVDPAARAWLGEFAVATAASGAGIFPRYRLLSSLLAALTNRKADLEKSLEASSPLTRFPDADSDQKERWETELAAAVEAEYRRCRSHYLSAIQWWLRDIWFSTLPDGGGSLQFPDLEASTREVARRLNPLRAAENLEAWERTQRQLHTNVQEALAFEVGLLKLQL